MKIFLQFQLGGSRSESAECQLVENVCSSFQLVKFQLVRFRLGGIDSVKEGGRSWVDSRADSGYWWLPSATRTKRDIS